MKRLILNGMWNFICYTFGIAFSLLIFAGIGYAIYHYTQTAFNAGQDFTEAYTAERPYKEATVTLDDGATIDDVSQILYKDGIITSPILFKLENMLNNNDKVFKAGTFVVNTDMDTNQLYSALRATVTMSNDVSVTIKEGYTTRDIGDLLASLGCVQNSGDFVDACETYSGGGFSFLDGIPDDRSDRLEGYLFPDTYMIAENSTPLTIINKLLGQFATVYTTSDEIQADNLGLTTDQVITIASIIEKEVSAPDERALVSAVIQNRIKAGMNLQMDSTVVYALDKRVDRLTNADLQVNSPYNTYVNPGLPVGPISNPGQACIEAALYPADVDYLYYVLKPDGSGTHFFTSDYDEFVNAKNKYTQSLDNGQ